jgi:hypothetical protein
MSENRVTLKWGQQPSIDLRGLSLGKTLCHCASIDQRGLNMYVALLKECPIKLHNQGSKFLAIFHTLDKNLNKRISFSILSNYRQ